MAGARTARRSVRGRPPRWAADLRGRVQPRSGPAVRPLRRRRQPASRSTRPSGCPGTDRCVAGLLAGLLAFGYLTWPDGVALSAATRGPGAALARVPGSPAPAPGLLLLLAEVMIRVGGRRCSTWPARSARPTRGADLAGHLAGRQRHLGALRRRAAALDRVSAARSARPTSDDDAPTPTARTRSTRQPVAGPHGRPAADRAAAEPGPTPSGSAFPAA